MKIPATVITGFLGAGKTTLVRHILENAKGKRIALIINEFGDLGVDRDMVTGCGIEGCEDDAVMELANGCICCTVADDFLPTMETLLDRDPAPDHIVIETSGLALPKPLIKAFNWPEIKTKVTVDGVLTVVDTPAVAAGRFADNTEAVQDQREADPNLDHDNPLSEVFEEQLNAADMLILNKADLVEPQDLAELGGLLGLAVRDGVKVVTAVEGKIDPWVLLGLGKAAEDDLAQRHSHHDGHHDDHDHDDFDTFVLSMGAIDDVEALVGRIEQAAVDHDILRVKGFLDVPGKPMRHVVQGVGSRIDRYFDKAWETDEDRRSELVIIGLHGIDHAAVEAAIRG